MLDTRPEWENIGPDFVARLAGQGAGADNVVPLRPARPVLPRGEGLWAQACARLAEEDRTLFESWFAALSEAAVEDGCLTLLAPSRFHASYVQTHLAERLATAVRRSDGTVQRVRVIAP